MNVAAQGGRAGTTIRQRHNNRSAGYPKSLHDISGRYHRWVESQASLWQVPSLRDPKVVAVYGPEFRADLVVAVDSCYRKDVFAHSSCRERLVDSTARPPIARCAGHCIRAFNFVSRFPKQHSITWRRVSDNSLLP